MAGSSWMANGTNRLRVSDLCLLIVNQKLFKVIESSRSNVAHCPQCEQQQHWDHQQKEANRT